MFRNPLRDIQLFGKGMGIGVLVMLVIVVWLVVVKRI